MAAPSPPHLGNSVINTAALRQLARKELCDLLDSVRGKKALVLDQQLSGPLSLIAEFSLLQDHGVEKIYYIQQGRLDTECRSLIYLSRPHLQYMKYIAEHIRTHAEDGQKLEYSLFFVPRRSMICERLLEEEGVYGDITIREYPLDLIPFEDDLLSLELEGSFKSLYLDKDYTAIYYVAKAVMKIQRLYGLIPRILGKGDCAQHLSDLLIRMRRELGVDDPAASLPLSANIDQLVILDRSIDLATPLCTQLTYEGLVDEVYGIKHSFVELDANVASTPAPSTAPTSGSTTAPSAPIPSTASKKKKVALNSSDGLFAQVRDLNFAVVGGILNRVAKRINTDYEERHQAKTVGQIRDFIGKLGDLQTEHMALRTHTAVAEGIMAVTVGHDFNRALEVQQNLMAGLENQVHIDYIEELIHRRAPLTQVLRLLCLWSTVVGGLKPKQYDHFRREIVLAYGYAHVLTLSHLADLSLFTKHDPSGPSRSVYSSARRPLRLIVDEVDEQSPNDIAYVYSGYAPLSVRVLQCALKSSSGRSGMVAGGTGSGGWKGWEGVLNSIPGKLVEEVQKVGNGVARAAKSNHQPRVTIVLFLGGCTFTEISAIRFLNQQDDSREFVVITTQILNGNTLLKPFVVDEEQVER